jgi:hypothetical protein
MEKELSKREYIKPELIVIELKKGEVLLADSCATIVQLTCFDPVHRISTCALS